MTVVVTVAVYVEDDSVDTKVYIGPNHAGFASGEKYPDVQLVTHRRASAIYDRVLDFAEQIKK